MAAQFVRIEAFSVKNVARVVGEANRDNVFCSHVVNPQTPKWWLGSPEEVAAAVASHMTIQVPYRTEASVIHYPKQRSDQRVVIGGVLSWPIPIARLASPGNGQLAKQLHQWILASIQWLRETFGQNLFGVCSHGDEPYPHLHSLVVGDANRLHPGLCAEFEDGKRLTNRREKKKRYKAVMRRFLDDYFRKVGSKFGLDRSTGKRPLIRIKDRTLVNRILLLERELAGVGDAESESMLDKIVEEAPKHPRPQMTL